MCEEDESNTTWYDLRALESRMDKLEEISNVFAKKLTEAIWCQAHCLAKHHLTESQDQILEEMTSRIIEKLVTDVSDQLMEGERKGRYKE